MRAAIEREGKRIERFNCDRSICPLRLSECPPFGRSVVEKQRISSRSLALWPMTWTSMSLPAQWVSLGWMCRSMPFARGWFAQAPSCMSDVGAAHVACAREQRNGMSAAGFDDRVLCTTRDERRSASWLRWDSRHAFIERVC